MTDSSSWCLTPLPTADAAPLTGGAVKRLDGSRRLLLGFLVPVSVGLFGFVPIGVVAVGWPEFMGRLPGAPWWAAVWLIPLIYCLARAPFVGIWVGDSSLVVRSWFTFRRIRRDQVIGCRSADYVGLFSVTAYPAGAGRFSLAVVAIETAAGNVALRGSVGPRVATRDHVREVLEWAGLGTAFTRREAE